MNNIVKPFPNIVLNALHVLAYLILIILCKVELLASTLQIKNSIENIQIHKGRCRNHFADWNAYMCIPI